MCPILCWPGAGANTASWSSMQPSELKLGSESCTTLHRSTITPENTGCHCPYVEMVECWVKVGTGDGRVKVLGKAGVEHTFPAFSRCDTQFLAFLLNKAALLRIAQVRF